MKKALTGMQHTTTQKGCTEEPETLQQLSRGIILCVNYILR
jgi:hypothetical protein